MKNTKTNRNRIEFKLTKASRARLDVFISSGQASPREFKRAQALLAFDEGSSAHSIGAVLGVRSGTVRELVHRCRERGIEQTLHEPVRRTNPRSLTKRQEEQIVALACGSPPDGRAVWSCQVLADEAIRLGFVKEVGRETVRLLLKEHDIKPWREKNVVCWKDR